MGAGAIFAIWLAGLVVLQGTTGLAAGLSFPFSLEAEPPPRYELAFHNTHTMEDLNIVYRRGDTYEPAALTEVNRFLRDHRNGHVHRMDRDLLNTLNDIKVKLERRHPGLRVRFDVISAYRSSESNEMLRKAGGSQAKHSQHIEGRAIDIRVSGVDLSELRDTAWCLHRGGVGYYAQDNFIHVDTGKKRFWNWSPAAVHLHCSSDATTLALNE